MLLWLAATLVDLAAFDPTIRLDIRYATAHNFLGRPVYSEARAFLRPEVARALAHAQADVRAKGYGLLVFDAYRPLSVTRLFWNELPPEKRRFVANPAKGSNHNRGCAVDVSLYDIAIGCARRSRLLAFASTVGSGGTSTTAIARATRCWTCPSKPWTPPQGSASSAYGLAR